MSTRTVVAVAAVIAAAIVGGAIIWALSDDESTREAELRATETPTGTISYKVKDLPTGEFAVDSYSVGLTKPTRSTATTTTTTTTADKYAPSEPLRFSKPLDAVSLTLFDEAKRSRKQPKVVLELLRPPAEGAQPTPVLRYEFTSAVLGKGDEAAANGQRSTQDLELFFTSMSIALESPGALGYAPADGSVGYLLIPGVADEPEKSGGGSPAYVVNYSWGWENPNAAAIASGATTTGKMMVNSLTVRRRLDSHAPWFWEQLIEARSTEVELHLALPPTQERPEAGVPYARYKLMNAKVVAIEDSGGEIPMQQIKLDFGPIELRMGQDLQTFTGSSRTG